MSGRVPDQPVHLALSLQRWEHLTFVHWRYPPAALTALVPPGLRLQLLDGSAWVGLTPFALGDLRVPVLPPVPGWSTFAETNLRTYVTDGRRDGVLFLRVHCARRLVTAGFRAGLGLPYAFVRGAVRPGRGTTTYEAPGTRVVTEIGDPLEPDPLVASLTGRWSAFSHHLGALLRVPVEHEAWPLHDARVSRVTTDLFRKSGIPDPRGEPLVHWSPRVDVRIGPPRLRPTWPRARRDGWGR